MKKYFFLLTSLFFLTGVSNVNAQFLGKLKKKVEDRVEQTVINKTADKAAQKTSKTMDKVFDPNLGGGKAGKKVTPQNVPASFDFEYQYRLTMTTATSKTKMNMDYFLKPGARYMGAEMSQAQNAFMIMDGLTNINYMFIKSGENKIATATAINGDDFLDDEPDNVNYDDFTITDLPNKTFLGYDCKGKKMESNEYIFTLYFTNEAPVTFYDVFKMDSDRIPAAIKNQFEEGEKATMMFMEMKDKLNKGKKDKSGTMECTLLEPKSFTFNTNGYKFM
ncbi:MAG: hypothetical protein CVU03_00345 [Bacteroidetes bacterium HGW-Bacteroidetes-2]|jgi:hypothetical protein|nr:MAG: hypothetical protein CVU03_00345 [Bacteroidetes bacterium HGW-Bacteroidetes-2]